MKRSNGAFEAALHLLPVGGLGTDLEAGQEVATANLAFWVAWLQPPATCVPGSKRP